MTILSITAAALTLLAFLLCVWATLDSRKRYRKELSDLRSKLWEAMFSGKDTRIRFGFGEEKTENKKKEENKKPDDIGRSMEYIEQDIRWINAAIDNIHNSLKDFHDIAFKVGKQYEKIENYTPLIEGLLKECLELLKEKYAKHAASISETKTPSE